MLPSNYWTPTTVKATKWARASGGAGIQFAHCPGLQLPSRAQSLISMLPLFLLPPTSSSKLSAQPQKVTLCCSTPYYASYQRIPHLFTNQAIAVNRSCKSDLPGHLPCSSRGSGWNSQPHSPHLSPPALATSRTAILCLIDRHSFIPQGPLEGECGSS